jgi:small subunit ribosomal protein S21
VALLKRHDLFVTQLASLHATMKDQPGKVVNFLAEVHLQDGETLESALRRFKRKVQQEDIVKEIKRHSFYLKPGEKRRTKEALARKRNRKKRPREMES